MTQKSMQLTWGFASAGADGVEPSFCTTISCGSGSTQFYSATQYILYFSNSIGLQSRLDILRMPSRTQSPERCLPCSTDIQLLSSLRLTAHDSFSIGLTQQQFIGITFFSFSTGTVNRRLKKMAGHHLQTLTS